jgi:intracellular sulfur oxidation DsrE/DsrF family protein
MSTPANTIQRRDFLGTLVATTAFGIANLAPFRLDAGQDQAAGSSSSAEFEAWLGKIQGKHKQLFDVPQHRGGLPFAWARVFMMTNEAVGTPEKDVSAVIVLRHEAIPLAMESRLWKKYKFQKMFGVTDMMKKTPVNENMWWQPKEGTLPLPGMSIDQLQKSGVLFGVCDMALTVYSMGAAEAMKMKPEEVKKDWVSGILPGIQIVPSGVLAVNRAQEHGCTYCFAR